MNEQLDILNCPLPQNDSGADTVRGYMVALLRAVFEHGEGFSGKRPFGNSGWEWDLRQAFLDAGLIPAHEADEWGRYDQLIDAALAELGGTS